MDKSSVLGGALGAYLGHNIDGPFLCGKGVGAYEGGEDFIRPPVEQACNSGEEYDEEEVAREDVRRWEDEENLEKEMGNSWWWRDAREGFMQDQRMWARIKESMARGCCRIVLRVDEGAQQWGKGVRTRRMGTDPVMGVAGMESELA
jgi:hypothetical protein